MKVGRRASNKLSGERKIKKTARSQLIIQQILI